MRALRAVYTTLADRRGHEAMSPAAEWLLDNFHLVSAAARDIHRTSRLVLQAAPLRRRTNSPDCRASMRWRSNSLDRARAGSTHSV